MGVKSDEDARQGRCEERNEVVVVREEEAMGLALTGRDSEAIDLVSDCNSSDDEEGDSMMVVRRMDVVRGAHRTR